MPVKTMEEEQVLCVRCYKEIEERVCERCMSEGIAVWFQDNNFSDGMQTLSFQGLRQRIPGLTRDGHCVRCSNEGSTICGECFFRMTARIFTELSRNRVVDNYFEQTSGRGVCSPI